MNDPDPPAAPKPNAPDSEPKRASWEDITLWLFLAALLVVSVTAGYLLWLKISFRSP